MTTHERANDVEQLRVQLAACLVAAEGGTSLESIANKGTYGWSPAYQATLDLALKYEHAKALLAKATEALQSIRVQSNGPACIRIAVATLTEIEKDRP